MGLCGERERCEIPMPSIYDDETRRKRFDINRKKKERLEHSFEKLALASIYLLAIFGAASAGLMLITGLGVKAENHNGLSSWGQILLQQNIIAAGLLSLPVYGGCLAAALLRKRNLCIYLMIFTALCVALVYSLLGIALLLPAVGFCIWLLFRCGQWADLSEEEGFPVFDITFAEQSERRQVKEKITRYQAELEGVRVKADEVVHRSDRMDDILDDESVPLSMHYLNGYHDRSREDIRDASPVLGILDSENMHQLAELDAMPHSSAETNS